MTGSRKSLASRTTCLWKALKNSGPIIVKILRIDGVAGIGISVVWLKFCFEGSPIIDNATNAFNQFAV